VNYELPHKLTTRMVKALKSELTDPRSRILGHDEIQLQLQLQ